MRNRVLLAALTISILGALSGVAQDRATWRTASDVQEGVRGSIAGTVADVDEARSQIYLEPDDDATRVTIVSDSVSTQYNGFGGIINGQPEVFRGSQGLSNVRVGDRLEVRGIGRGNYSVRADVVTLRGRQVAASPTGVGTSRTNTSVSTPTATTTVTTPRVGSVEGVVQEVNAGDGRIVVVTDRREVIAVRTSGTTPVYFRGETYRVANLEIGDRIRIEPENTGGGIGSELRARSIEVTRSAQGETGTSRATTLAGRVSRIDRTIDIVTVDTGRQSVRVDVATAVDNQGRRVRAADFRSGERVDLSGRYSPTASDLFIATTVRFGDDPDAPLPATGEVDVVGSVGGELGAVTIYATVRETLAASPQLVIRDTNGRTIRLHVLEDFVIRGRNGAIVTADSLKANDSIVVKAFRDADGNYIAQTIRFR